MGNNGKGIHIAYGTAIFIILGLVAVAFFIWYPLQNVREAKADIDNLPHPTTFLQGTDLNSFNAIETHARDYMLAEALPQLIDEVFDVGQEPTEDDVEFLTVKLVRLYKEAHDGIEAQKQALITSANLTQDTISACSYNTSLFSYNNKVVVSHHSQCEHQMASISAGVWLKGPGYSSGWLHYVRHQAKSASLSKSRSLSSGCWNGWGAGAASPENDGPNPSPGTGDRQLKECY